MTIQDVRMTGFIWLRMQWQALVDTVTNLGVT
jgi:hypothetical protein